MKRAPYRPDELKFIRDNFEIMTDAKMARILHRTPAVICVQRSKLALVRRVRNHKRTLPEEIEPPRPVDWPMPVVHPGFVITGVVITEKSLLAYVDDLKRTNGTYNKPKGDKT